MEPIWGVLTGTVVKAAVARSTPQFFSDLRLRSGRKPHRL